MHHGRSNSTHVNQKVPPIGHNMKQRKGSNGTGSSHRITNSARPNSSSRQKIKRINSAKSNQDKKASALNGTGVKKH